MSKKRSITASSVLRAAVQVFFLVAGIVLLVAGKLQMWFAVFAVGVLASLFVGRVYCGWACPMNTLFRPVAWFYKKTGLKRIQISWTKKIYLLRFLPLALFVAVMIITRRSQLPVPVLALITVLSFVVTLFFEEAVWHNLMCPFGTILSLTAKKTLRTYRVEPSGCIACGKCQTVCPVHAIDILEDGKRSIRKNDCISCGKCVHSCPVKVISW